MRRLSNTAIKRIIAGSLALALTFTSVGLNNFTWADEDEVEEVQEVDVDENANTDETIDEGSESELPTDEVVSADEETEEVASNDENTEEVTEAENSEEDANSKDVASESDDAEKCEHEDADEDGTCDKCGKSMSDEEAEVCEHVDEDEDGICDKCGEEMPKEDTEESDTEKVFELNATEIKLGIDDTFMVTATLDGENVTESIELSTDDKVVTIEDYTISANKEGEAVVTAKYVDNEDAYTASINVVVVDEIIIDDYHAFITFFDEVEPIFTASDDTVEDALPKTVKASIIMTNEQFEENGYNADELLANGFVYDEGFYIKDSANIEISWKDDGTNEAGGHEYAGRVASSNYKKSQYLVLPEATVYVYDGEYSGQLDPNTFVPIATDGNVIASIDDELELSFAYPSRTAAWKEKYLSDEFDIILKYGPDFFESLKPGTKTIAETYQTSVRYSDALGNYISNLPLNDFLTYKNEGKIDLSSTIIAGNDFTDEQLAKLGSYGFTILDIAQYISAYNGFDNSSTLYRLHQMGEHSESLDYLYETIDGMYHTNDIIYINGRRTNYKNVEAVENEKAAEEAMKAYPMFTEDIAETETETDETIETSFNLLDLIASKFTFINASAADDDDEEPVRSGDGWYDHLASGHKDTFEQIGRSQVLHIDKNGSVNVAGHNTYIKSVREYNAPAFCCNPFFQLGNATYTVQKWYSNGWAAFWADNTQDYELRQATMWYACGMDTNADRLANLKTQIEQQYGSNHIFQKLYTGDVTWLEGKYGPAVHDSSSARFYVLVATNKGANQQVLFMPVYETYIPTPEEIMISTETRYATGSASTTYKSDLDKYSVITNEKLSGIQFHVQERIANNPKHSLDVRENDWTVTTNGNGYASITSPHSASWSVPYEVIKDEDAILEYIGTGECSDAFKDYYEELRSQIDNGGSGLRNESSARAEVNRLKNAFLAVEYDYTWTEQNTYNRPASSQDQNNKTLNLISFPKQGYRMNITKIDNSNKYSAVSDSDLTSPSTKTTSAVHDGGNGHVDISNQPWRAQIFINKTDLETNNQIKYDTKFDIYEMENGKYPEEPSKNYRVVRINEEIANEMNWDKSTVGMYTIEYIGTTFGGTNPADDKQHTPLKYGTVYYTQSNTGKFKIVETKAPSYEEGKTGYIGNFAKRPYTRVENDLDSRFALSGRTDKTYPAPQQIVKVAAGNCRYCQFNKVLHHLYGQE